jgi:hypothetical protein
MGIYDVTNDQQEMDKLAEDTSEGDNVVLLEHEGFMLLKRLLAAGLREVFVRIRNLVHMDLNIK